MLHITYNLLPPITYHLLPITWQDSVSVSSVVGSAVFNITLVIGVCSLVTPRPLHLHWYPVIRYYYTSHQCSPLSLVELKRGSALIGPEVQSVAGAGNLMPYSSHPKPPTGVFITQNNPIGSRWTTLL